MSKDEYYVMAYKLLKYLYDCLRKDDQPNSNLIKANTKHFPVGEKYFTYLIENLANDGYIRNVKVTKYDDDVKVIFDDNIQITPKGIEYLEENGLMNKIAEALKTAADLIH